MSVATASILVTLFIPGSFFLAFPAFFGGRAFTAFGFLGAFFTGRAFSALGFATIFFDGPEILRDRIEPDARSVFHITSYICVINFLSSYRLSFLSTSLLSGFPCRG
jgi:hypothetical protein